GHGAWGIGHGGLIGLTQKTSQTLISPCRASCFSCGRRCANKSGNPPNCTGFSAVACGKPLCVYVFPLPVRKP
ncbi:hypothetical protein, partial [aff. Roholtiella sp. LEGE 12411]|uniref:hypothetical protein n=1 Tax=aff. Roholtiella sp. LEGE 12411 TaxID=1828822 RepID=UPI001ABC892D